MFTGIVEAIGKVVKYDANRLGIRTPFRQIRLGESISVDGVCLTVARKSGPRLFFDVGPETRRITTLGQLQPVNLERALRVGDGVGGHWVTGHVERTGTVIKIEPAYQTGRRSGKNRWITLRVPTAIAKYVVPKGSLTVDGISLTVVAIKQNQVKIMLVPLTVRRTTLAQKRVGDAVNLEADLIAKYAEKLKRGRLKIPYALR
jgi:riboflavin synthase alpha subunit